MVVHRDLKPENLLLDGQNRVKIADFGLSNIMIDGDFLRTSCGSPNYAAPEVISGKLYAGPEVDVWSAGVILYALLCGTLPFDDEHMPSLFRKIKSGIFPIPEYLEKPVVNLLLHMLQVDSIKRATIKDVINHEWFRINLPAYLFPPINEGDASIIDIDAVRDVSYRFNVSEEDVTNALLGDDPHDKLSVAYNLIVDNKRIASEIGHGQHLHPLAIMQKAGGPVLDSPNPVIIHSKSGIDHLTHCPAVGNEQQKRSLANCDNCPIKGVEGCPFSHEEHGKGSAAQRQRSATTEQKKPAKMSINDFYHIAPASKLLQADQASSRHPERMNTSSKITSTLDYKEQSVPSPQGSKSPHTKRAKWHLGIRSQSNPMDIMYEVFRAMRHLNFEWKILQAYHCIVRKKPEDPKLEVPKMSLQLYQVDPRNYLLDFKNLVDDDGSMPNDANSLASRHASVSMPIRPSLRNHRAQSLPMPFEVAKVQRVASAQAAASAELNRNSQTMQFFEMCAALIGALAR